MERPPKFTLLDETGHPFGAHIQAALTSLTPRLLRHYPALRDEWLLIGILETAARKITNRERESGPIAKLHGYAWVTLQTVATSRLRQGRGRLAQKLLESDVNGVSLDGVPARTGTADEIERAVLWREVLARLSMEERRVCMWKKAGYTSDEIAEYPRRHRVCRGYPAFASEREDPKAAGRRAWRYAPRAERRGRQESGANCSARRSG